jgi:hypothetical protein
MTNYSWGMKFGPSARQAARRIYRSHSKGVNGEMRKLRIEELHNCGTQRFHEGHNLRSTDWKVHVERNGKYDIKIILVSLTEDRLVDQVADGRSKLSICGFVAQIT